jgi:hypothetical protein
MRHVRQHFDNAFRTLVVDPDGHLPGVGVYFVASV